MQKNTSVHETSTFMRMAKYESLIITAKAPNQLKHKPKNFLQIRIKCRLLGIVNYYVQPHSLPADILLASEVSIIQILMSIRDDTSCSNVMGSPACS